MKAEEAKIVANGHTNRKQEEILNCVISDIKNQAYSGIYNHTIHMYGSTSVLEHQVYIKEKLIKMGYAVDIKDAILSINW